MERLAVESKISALAKQKATLAIKADMQILTIRAEANPLLDFEQIDVDRLTIAVGELCDYVDRSKELDKEIKRFEKML